MNVTELREIGSPTESEISRYTAPPFSALQFVNVVGAVEFPVIENFWSGVIFAQIAAPSAEAVVEEERETLAKEQDFSSVSAVPLMITRGVLMMTGESQVGVIEME